VASQRRPNNPTPEVLMNFLGLALVALTFLTGLANLSQPTVMIARDTATTRVAIDNYAFKAPTTVVAVGGSVTWKNLDDDPHTVTATDGSFDSKGLAQGDTFTYRFTKPGTYTYYCKVHPMMRGTIIVKEVNS
jgi:plastocyanin